MKLSRIALIVLIGLTAAVAPSWAKEKSTLVASETGDGPQYYEGALTYFEVRSNGVRVITKKLDAKAVSLSLDEGKYELSSYVRPCDGNCKLLDPPENECHGMFSLKSGETLYVIRQQTRSGPCTLKFSSTKP